MGLLGEYRFNHCQVKNITLIDRVYLRGNEGDSVISQNPEEDYRTYAGTAAVLACPRSGGNQQEISSQYSNHSSKITAVKNLGKQAGAIICSNCTFYNKSPAEVATLRAQQAKAEADYITALALRTQALQQLGSTDPAYRDPEVRRIYENLPIPSNAQLPELPPELQLR